jgi:hypothetical protein
MLNSGPFKTIWVLAILAVRSYLKKIFIKIKKNYQSISYPPIKCVYQAFIIQNLDVLTLELGMKVCDLWKY